jgi:hypothetical protein
MAWVKRLRVWFNRQKARGPDHKPGILLRLSVFVVFSLFISATFTVQEAASAAPYIAWKTGNFTKTTSAAPASQAVSGVGFQPAAVIFYWTRQTATGQAANISAGYGFATGSSNERAIAIASDDNLADSNTGSRQSQDNCIILLSNGTPTLGAQAELTSFDSDGFTLNWTTNESRADIIYYVAIGGPDLTNALASSFTLTTGAGSQAITGVGFQPDFLMFLSIDNTSMNANLTTAKASIGFASSATAEASVATVMADASAKSNTQVRQRTDNCLNEITPNSGNNLLADLTSFDSGGFLP